MDNKMMFVIIIVALVSTMVGYFLHRENVVEYCSIEQKESYCNRNNSVWMPVGELNVQNITIIQYGSGFDEVFKYDEYESVNPDCRNAYLVGRCMGLRNERCFELLPINLTECLGDYKMGWYSVRPRP